ncbi:MerR family DNA-binding transcriptional regulator [Bifidobacterium leontopitheci]|uniref:MerR family DNA-binding transcriptional regulator n=1 Tax=Bifidobacterium leontopitheci TaxID=2650774 RepID=UPI001D02A5BB|nr:MerR family DNA-binding transcriptional regulator [Bifidobacterium leontopitheci]
MNEHDMVAGSMNDTAVGVVDVEGDMLDPCRLWPIDQAARISGVTTRTLRYYDETGLVKPTETTAGGKRWYDWPTLVRLQFVAGTGSNGRYAVVRFAGRHPHRADRRPAFRGPMRRVIVRQQGVCRLRQRGHAHPCAAYRRSNRERCVIVQQWRRLHSHPGIAGRECAQCDLSVFLM